MGKERNHNSHGLVAPTLASSIATPSALNTAPSNSGLTAPSSRTASPAPSRHGSMVPSSRGGSITPSSRGGSIAPSSHGGSIAPSSRGGSIAPTSRSISIGQARSGSTIMVHGTCSSQPVQRSRAPLLWTYSAYSLEEMNGQLRHLSDGSQPPPYNNITGEENENSVGSQFDQDEFTNCSQGEPFINEISPDEDERGAEATLRAGGE